LTIMQTQTEAAVATLEALTPAPGRTRMTFHLNVVEEETVRDALKALAAVEDTGMSLSDVARTALRRGLLDMLAEATRRSARKGGQPVADELQGVLVRARASA
jgi:chloramphenicol 3-O-phosphotransferase